MNKFTDPGNNTSWKCTKLPYTYLAFAKANELTKKFRTYQFPRYYLKRFLPEVDVFQRW